MDGILLLNKPINITSRDLVNMACKKFQTKKIGHTGTLDPFASGLMILTINKATKISTFIEATKKKYVAEITFGKMTDTYDIDGKIIEEKEVNLPSNEEINKVFKSFLGHIKQVPPMYSAIKVNGKKLYELAREGIEIERKERDVFIYDINVLSISDGKILFDVTCSKGTYIRSLAIDIAKKMNQIGFLSLLTRTEIGSFKLTDAKNIEDVKEEDIIPISKSLDFLTKIILDDVLEKKAINGVKLKFNMNDKLILLMSKNQEAIAVYELREDGYYYCLRGLR